MTGNPAVRIEMLQGSVEPGAESQNSPFRRSRLVARRERNAQRDKIGRPTGATRFRRKLSRLEGMPGVTCPQSGETIQLATMLSWLSLPNQN